MKRDTFPYWPPTSPQRPANIAGRTASLMIQDLSINQIPRGRSDEIPLRPVPVPRIRKPELPATPEGENRGVVKSSLYDLYMTTEAMPREQLFRALSNG